MNARHYDSIVGRFMAVDPVWFTTERLIQFNRYQYGNNNPYRFTDPTGMLASSTADGGPTSDSD